MIDPAEIQQQGACARMRGEHMIANPYYKARNMPFTTGESTAEWNEKAIAWRRGWERENLMCND